MDFGRKLIVWHDRSTKLWTAVYQNSLGDQLGNAGFGSSKKDAIADLEYQQVIDT
jgi:hypothetical protein